MTTMNERVELVRAYLEMAEGSREILMDWLEERGVNLFVPPDDTTMEHISAPRHASLNHNRRVMVAQAVLGCIPVRQGHVPGWARRNMQRYLRENPNFMDDDRPSYFATDPSTYMLRHIASHIKAHLDHMGSAKIPSDAGRPQVIFVNEPYPSVGRESMLQLAEIIGSRLVENHELSWHYPLYTMRYEFWNNVT